MGQLEKPLFIFIGPRKGALFVTEEFTGEQCLGESRTILGDKRFLFSSTIIMDASGNKLLTCPRLSFDQHSNVRVYRFFAKPQDRQHDIAIAFDLLKPITRFNFTAQTNIFLFGQFNEVVFSLINNLQFLISSIQCCIHSGIVERQADNT